MEEQKLLKRRRKAMKDNNEAVLVSTCTDLANLYMDEGRYDFAIEEFTTVANIYKKQNKQLDFAVVNRGIGEAFLGLHQFEKALHHQKIYLDTARALQNKLEEQRALATIGHTYLSRYLEMPAPDKNNLDLAHKFFKKSLIVSQSLNGQANKIEIADMSARLLSNLGLVQDCMGNFEMAIELISKSINLCKLHDLYEQLQRGYVSLASLLIKKGDHKSALQQYNLAADAAIKLRNKPGLLAGILLSKSEILVKLGDLQGAKNTLLKAYKLKIPDVEEHKTIERNLRVVASMCYTEDKLLVTDVMDYAQLKKLYEKMGDGACELKLYEKALDYYKKMLDSAIKAGLTGPDLGSCYYSLAETYKDNGQFDEAVAYFEEELKLCRELKDVLNTLSKISDTKETADAPVSEVQVVYNRAIELCQNENNVHEEGRMLKRLITYLRRQKQHSAAFQLEQDLAKLNYESSDGESESSEAPAGSIIGADIDLEAITDVSDDSDMEQPTAKPRRRTKNFQVRRNVKGETQLHTACIKGQLNIVHVLIEQGHPVNVRDNCGWLPLHEACINGHIEVVRLLLEKGAAINDRGGTQCEGVTPLHDAASNGHLSIVQLLLSKGANAVAKTDEGGTVLDFLKKWRSTVQLDDDSQILYESLVEQVSQALEKAGHVTEKASASHTQTDTITTSKRDMRRSAIVGLEDDGLMSQRSGTDDYRDVMENLRRRNDLKVAPRATKGKRPALLGCDDVIDDWLEDDVGKTTKKRKTNSPAKSRKPNSPAKSYSSRKSSSPAKSHCSRRSLEEVVDSDDSIGDVQMFCDDDDWPNPYQSQNIENVPSQSYARKAQISPLKNKCNPKPSPTKFVRKKQTKLSNFGHSRTIVEADSTVSPKTSRDALETIPKKLLTKTHSFDQPVLEPTLSVDVRINKKLYRVPILLSQVSTHTIKWLADEAAARYARKEYMIPTVELETKNGAILADDDPLSLLFPMGATQAEEVEARIVKWSVPPLIDRYKEACQDMSVESHDAICRILQEFSVSLDLSNRGFKGSKLSPLCRVLNRQTNLIELDLSGNFLTNECFQFLGASIASLENLYKLNLSCTGLRSEHVQILTNSLANEVAYKVGDLDFSDNLIGDECFESLAVLTRRFQLKKINLSGNKFTKNLFDHSFNKELTLSLDQTEEVDLSDNDLSNEVVFKILSWLNSSNLTSLNVSRCALTDGFLKDLLDNWTDAGKLKVCKLSRSHVRDSDLFDLLRIAPLLETLDVSYSDDLTSISLRKLFQSDIQNLILYGCKNILHYFTEFSKYLDDQNKGKTIKISLPENCDKEKGYLIQMWRDLYGEKTVVELSSRFLCLSLLK